MSRSQRVVEMPIRRRIELFERVYADLKANPYRQAQDAAITFNVFGDHTEVSTNLDDEHVWISFLTGFRQMISSDDHSSLNHVLRELPPHIDDAGLRQRLREARRAWKAAQGVPSQFAPLVLGDFAAGRDLVRLYLYGGRLHTDPELSDHWQAMTPNERTFVKYQVRVYESKVRNVIVEVHKVINEALDKNVLTDEPLDLGAGRA